jgi:hypothetical protein
MENLKFEDLPKAMELVIEKLTNIELQLNNLKHNFKPKEPIELISPNGIDAILEIMSLLVQRKQV